MFSTLNFIITKLKLLGLYRFAMRQKLELILEVKIQENNTILIQLVNINDDDKNAALAAESYDPLREQITFTAPSTVAVNVPSGDFESAL